VKGRLIAAKSEEVRQRERRRTLRAVMAAFFGGLLLLSMFANTYRQMTLPKVQAEEATLGSLSFTIEGEGTVEAMRETEVYDRTGWKVVEVAVEENQTVSKGDLLLRLDTTPAEQELADDQVRLEKYELQLNKLLTQYKELSMAGSEDQSESVEQDIRALRLDMELQRRKMERLRERIDEEGTVRAPVDGVVLNVAAKEGLPNGQGAAVVLADAADGWGLSVDVDEELASYISPGQEVTMQIVGDEYRTANATLQEIEDSGQGDSRKRLRFRFADGTVQGGERARFRWTNQSRQPGLLVPNEALAQDGNGTYVYVVNEKKSPLGNEFTVQKVYVTTGDSDGTSTLVVSGLSPKDRIVKEASEPLGDGDRVRL